MRILIAAAVGLALASVASAQTAPPDPSPAALDAYAASLLTTGHAEGVFAREASERVVALRHTASGLRCLFGLGSEGAVSVFPTEPLGIAHGDDVGCDANTGFGKLTLYATRYPHARAAAQAVANATEELRHFHPDARSAHVDAPTLPINRPVPPSSLQYFTYRLGGQEMLTRISIAEIDGWEYKMRFTTDTPRANPIAEMTWLATLADIADRNAATAPATPAQQPQPPASTNNDR